MISYTSILELVHWIRSWNFRIGEDFLSHCSMIFLLLLIYAFINSSYAEQNYFPNCTLDSSIPGLRYTCNSFMKSCHTFLVYRATENFKSLSEIANLFELNLDNSDEVLHVNNLTSSREKLTPGRDVLIPINCSCSGQFFQAKFSYTVPGNTTYSEISCGVFEGLVTWQALVQENQARDIGVNVGSKLHVPLRCACPDSEGVEYLVTYPFVEGDNPKLLCEKFNISIEDLCAANHLPATPTPTVYPNTTFLVPLKSYPNVKFDIKNPQPPAPGFLPTITTEKTGKSKLRTVYIVGSVVGFSLMLVALVSCGLYAKALRKWKRDQRILSFNTRSSTQISFETARSSPRSGQTGRSSPLSGQTGRSSANSCLSPDLLAGIKYSLSSYSMEEIKRAANGFSEDNKIGDQSFEGVIDNAEVMIKQMRFEDTRMVIDVHSKINHKNIVSLHGVCYGENDFAWSYLVFQLPSKGCLRDLLSSSSTPLRWKKRTQIAFDVSTALHYLHHCIFPTYAHMGVNSRNIFITEAWRAKLGSIEANPGVRPSKGSDNASSVKGWVAPEYLLHGSTSEKVDIFAFGVVLLELLSAREDMDGKLFKDCIGFLGGGGSEGGCFEQLRSFMDPFLKEDYPLAEALCLAVLAKACVEDDPLHRPSMDDIIKVLARIVRSE